MTREQVEAAVEAIRAEVKAIHAPLKEKGQGKMVRYRIRVSPELESGLWAFAFAADYQDGLLRGLPVMLDFELGLVKHWAIEVAGPEEGK